MSIFFGIYIVTSKNRDSRNWRACLKLIRTHEEIYLIFMLLRNRCPVSLTVSLQPVRSEIYTIYKGLQGKLTRIFFRRIYIRKIESLEIVEMFHRSRIGLKFILFTTTRAILSYDPVFLWKRRVCLDSLYLKFPRNLYNLQRTLRKLPEFHWNLSKNWGWSSLFQIFMKSIPFAKNIKKFNLKFLVFSSLSQVFTKYIPFIKDFKKFN